MEKKHQVYGAKRTLLQSSAKSYNPKHSAVNHEPDKFEKVPTKPSPFEINISAISEYPQL